MLWNSTSQNIILHHIGTFLLINSASQLPGSENDNTVITVLGFVVAGLFSVEIEYPRPIAGDTRLEQLRVVC